MVYIKIILHYIRQTLCATRCSPHPPMASATERKRVYYVGNDRGGLYGRLEDGSEEPGKPVSARCWGCTDRMGRDFLMMTTPDAAAAHGIVACDTCGRAFKHAVQ